VTRRQEPRLNALSVLAERRSPGFEPCGHRRAHGRGDRVSSASSAAFAAGPARRGCRPGPESSPPQALHGIRPAPHGSGPATW
jgi:hypothetical protein